MSIVESTMSQSLPENPMPRYANLVMYDGLRTSTDSPDHHAKYIELLLTDLDSKEFVESFSIDFSQASDHLKGMLPHLTIGSDDTKKLLLVHMDLLESQLRAIRVRIQKTDVIPVDTTFEKFKTLLLQNLGCNSSLFPEAALEPMIRMFYEPVKLIIENSTSSQEEKDEIISSVIAKMEMMQPTPDDTTEKTNIPILTPRVIEVPASIIEESIVLHQNNDTVSGETLHLSADDVETRSPRTRKKSQTKDPVMGE